MTAEISACSYCGKKGHYARNCWRKRDDNNSKSTGSNDKQKDTESSNGETGSKDTAEQRWCSLHKTTTYDDAECYAQGAPRPSQNDGAHIATSAALGATKPPANDDDKPSLNFDDDFDKGFEFIGLLSDNGERGFHPNSE